jgi:hypothetical protein
MLGLPNDTTMESRSFSTMEERIASVLQQLTEKILDENLQEDVRISMEASSDYTDNSFHLWKESVAGNIALDLCNYPRLSVSLTWAGNNKAPEFIMRHLQDMLSSCWQTYKKSY